MPDSSTVKTLAITAAALAVLTLGACSSDAPEPSAQTFPTAKDGSVITGGGYVFKGDFAICNQAKCQAPDANGTAQCTCDLLTDEWTLSPIPKSALDALNARGTTVSTFTTVNVAQARSVKCKVGQWADCYGALCVPNDDGTATCTCPVSDDESVEWMKYVDSCTAPSAGCTADLQSVAPLFRIDPSFQDYLAVVQSAGDSVPQIPQACPIPSE